MKKRLAMGFQNKQIRWVGGKLKDWQRNDRATWISMDMLFHAKASTIDNCLSQSTFFTQPSTAVL